MKSLIVKIFALQATEVALTDVSQVFTTVGEFALSAVK
jgi:hypothetical protein